MAENSGISWTTHTFNPWLSCTKVSPACQFCYAERDMDHRYGKVKWGPSGNRVVTGDANWNKPLKWNREAERAGVRQRVFCASLGDVFEKWDGKIHHSNGSVMLRSYGDGGRHWAYEGQPRYPGGHDWCDLTMQDVRDRLFRLIDSTPSLDWLLLTKRPENILKMIPRRDDVRFGNAWHRPNVWLGTTVENQEYADKRIPELLKCRDLAPVLFLSCEPLLGPVDLTKVEFKYAEQTHIDCLAGTHHNGNGGGYPAQKVDWVIGGGESGPKARPTNIAWARSLRDQCKAAGVAWHWKQNGEWVNGVEFSRDDGNYVECQHGEVIKVDRGVPVHYWDDEEGGWPNHENDVAVHVGTKKSGRLLDGVLHDAFPKVGS